MSLIRVADAGVQFGARWIFRHATLTVGAGERWGVVGRNGEGKTTLLRLLNGETTPTEGEVWRHPGTRFTLLDQMRSTEPGATVMQAALEPFAELIEMERRLEADAARLAELQPGSAETARVLQRYDRDVEQFRRRGGYEMRARARATLDGLGFAEATWTQPVETLSGGERGRLALVQTLLAAPDVLLLDEPTNHLDLPSTEWLEDYLRGYPGTVLAVSHDRAFLERLVDRVAHVEFESVTPYTGGYAAFVEQREERREQRRREWERQQQHIARTEDFIRRNIAGQKTKQAKSRRAQLARLDRVDRVRDEDRAMSLGFSGSRRSGGLVLRTDGLSCAVGGRVLFEPFDAEVARGECVAVVGRNGCGKSTLMRALAGAARPATGKVELGAGVRAAYYRQDFTDLDPGHTVREAVEAAAPQLATQALRDHVARFLFTGDDIEARVGDLSGGEQARVALARITLQGANLLLLDEPTNHLDIPSREMLEEALDGFDGTVLVISHDRAFLSAVSTRVWAFEDGGRGPARIRDYPGGFDDWLRSRQHQASQAQAQAKAERAEPVAAPAGNGGAAGSGLSKNELRRRALELERVEERIGALEAAVGEAEAELADPALYAAGADPERVREITARRDAADAELEALYETWAQLGEELAAT